MESATNPVDEKKFFVDGVEVTREEAESASGTTLDPTAGMETHTITQEDIDANPGIEEDVAVGDEVFLPSPESVEEFGSLEEAIDAAPESSN